MKVRLNLATKALETHRRFLVGAGLTAALAGFAFLGLGWHVYSARKVDAELRTRTERTRQEMAKLETQRKDLERYFSQKDIANLVGASRPRVTEHLARLEREAFVIRQGRQLIVRVAKLQESIGTHAKLVGLSPN